MARAVIMGWFADRSLIIKIRGIHNCLNYCVYFCNMWRFTNVAAGCRLDTHDVRLKRDSMLQERFELETSRIKITYDLQEWLQLMQGGWGSQSWHVLPRRGKIVYSLRWNKECDVIYVFYTFVDLIEFFLFRLVCLFSSYKIRRVNVSWKVMYCVVGKFCLDVTHRQERNSRVYVYVYVCVYMYNSHVSVIWLKNHKIHALFHGLFHRQFMYCYMNPLLISSIGMLSSGCAVLCCVLDGQLFLQSQSLPHSELVLLKL